MKNQYNQRPRTITLRDAIGYSTGWLVEAEAVALCVALQADDEFWRYQVERLGSWFVIAIFDEDGHRLGLL